MKCPKCGKPTKARTSTQGVFKGTEYIEVEITCEENHTHFARMTPAEDFIEIP